MTFSLTDPFKFPPGTARLAATESLAALWTSQDTQAAAAWVNSLPAGPQQEVALAAFNRAAGRADRVIEPDSPPEDAAP